MMALTKSPTPSWRDFFPIFPVEELPEPFAAYPTWFCMNGRNAIYHALDALDIAKGSTILVPAYHCTAMVDPIIHYGAAIQFYTVNPDLSLNLSEIESSAEKGSAAVLFVHFFGVPGPVNELAAIAKKYRIYLIEDCTHALFGKIGNRYMGTFGDAAIFSFRKTLHVSDGGALIVHHERAKRLSRRTKVRLIYQARMAKWTLDSMLGHEDLGAAKSGSLAYSERGELVARLSNLSRGPDSHEDSRFRECWSDWPMSYASTWLLRRAEVNSVKERRVRNYRRLHARISNITGLTPSFPEIVDDVCPLAYPFTVGSAERVDYQLRALGIPAFSFGERLHGTLPIERFPGAKFLSDNLTLLPIHHGLSESDVDEMADRVIDFFLDSNLK